MTDDTLNAVIMQALSRRKNGMSEKTLKAETVIGYDDLTLKTADFKDALRQLEDKAFIETFPDLAGDPLWAITDLGLAYLREKGL